MSTMFMIYDFFINSAGFNLFLGSFNLRAIYKNKLIIYFKNIKINISPRPPQDKTLGTRLVCPIPVTELVFKC